MAKFNVSDTLAFDTKTLLAGNAAIGLWVRAGSWSACYDTDGFVPCRVARGLGPKRQAQQLLTAGLWECEPGGYRFVQWGDLQRDTRIIPGWMRSAVINRDGYACQLCGGEVAPDDVHLDHIKRWAKGGHTAVDNLRVTHSACNMGRSRR